MDTHTLIKPCFDPVVYKSIKYVDLTPSSFIDPDSIDINIPHLLELLNKHRKKLPVSESISKRSPITAPTYKNKYVQTDFRPRRNAVFGKNIQNQLDRMNIK